jgi:hypothetical protein
MLWAALDRMKARIDELQATMKRLEEHEHERPVDLPKLPLRPRAELN